MKSYTKILGSVIVMAISASLWAAEFHVAPGGNDANNGTAAKPFATIEYARDAVRKLKAEGMPSDGITVCLHGGTYRLEKTLAFGPEDSGTSESPVVWKAVAGEKPILSGGVSVTGWTPDANGRFKATVNLDNFRQLWVNGQRAQRARGEVPAGMKFWGKNEATVIKYDNPPGLTGTPGYQPGKLDKIAPAGYTTTDAKLAGLEESRRHGVRLSSARGRTRSPRSRRSPRSDDGAIIEMSQPGFFLCNRAGGAVAGMPAYLENALELLDEPGEWYFDRPANTLYYLPRPGEDMSKAEVIAPKLETLVEVQGAHDIRFEGLTFSHATWLRPSTPLGHPDVQANFIQPVDNSYFRPEHEKGWVPVNGEQLKSAGNVVVNACRGLRFEGCTFTALGATALDLENGAQSNTVVGCRFEDISASAIQVGDISREDHHPSTPERVVKDNHIVNNVITRIGVDYTDAIGMFVGYTEGHGHRPQRDLRRALLRHLVRLGLGHARCRRRRVC